MKEKGLIQIYCGDGKGKTTAAIGQVIRAAGHGYRVRVIQFMKDGSSGECAVLANIPGVEISSFGRSILIDRNAPDSSDIQLATQGLNQAYAALKENWDMLVLDEIIVAAYFNLLKEADILQLCHLKPENMELVFTGRPVGEALAKKAHLITEVSAVKHPYQQGINAREGIEY